MAPKSEKLLVRMSPQVREILTRAAHVDHRPLANFLVHAGLVYAKQLLGTQYEEVSEEE